MVSFPAAGPGFIICLSECFLTFFLHEFPSTVSEWWSQIKRIRKESCLKPGFNYFFHNHALPLLQWWHCVDFLACEFLFFNFSPKLYWRPSIFLLLHARRRRLSMRSFRWENEGVVCLYAPPSLSKRWGWGCFLYVLHLEFLLTFLFALSTSLCSLES